MSIPCSYNTENFIYLADFPKESSIKYLVNSFQGDVVIVTETEEVGCLAPLSASPNPPPQGNLRKDMRNSIYNWEPWNLYIRW